MKPQFAIASVVVAVLATVVVEETRIAKLRDELNRLKAIPADTPPIVPVADDPGEPGVPDQPADGTLEPPDSGETTVTPAASPVGFRAVPEDYPEPAPERVKALALSPYALLHLELGLNPRECAYLDDLLEQRARSLQQLAGRWLALPGAGFWC
ncbi:hypothetical protein [uncultured Marinobacter sp.]|uniref:hypothetical protein n=1 Tax=uncultured Marinobacter sp. TaxID=187379 RepID=UPI0025FE9676|nr:hypothetical protein [uncultured Marinobacter sp.]